MKTVLDLASIVETGIGVGGLSFVCKLAALSNGGKMIHSDTGYPLLQKEIGERLEVDETTVVRRIKELVAAGVLVIDHISRYRLIRFSDRYLYNVDDIRTLDDDESVVAAVV